MATKLAENWGVKRTLQQPDPNQGTHIHQYLGNNMWENILTGDSAHTKLQDVDSEQLACRGEMCRWKWRIVVKCYIEIRGLTMFYFSFVDPNKDIDAVLPCNETNRECFTVQTVHNTKQLLAVNNEAIKVN